MHFIRKNFVFIFLIISSLSMGILAFATALRLRDLRSATPSQTSALTPPCTFTFNITDSTPRNLGLLPTASPLASPTASLIAQKTITPTKTTVIGALPSSTPTPTAKPKPTSSPTPTKASVTKPTTTPTIVQPDVPVAGETFPTAGIIILGLLLLSWGILSKKSSRV